MIQYTVRFWQCLATIIISLIAAATFAIPFCFIDDGIILSHAVMPFIKSNENPITVEFMAQIDSAFLNLTKISLSEGFASLLPKLSFYSIYVFYGILAFNIVFSLLAIFTQLEAVRFFAKIISVIAGFLMIAIAILSAVHIVGVVSSYLAVESENLIETLTVAAKESGILYFLGVFIFSIVMATKQFGWFALKDLDD